MANAVIMPRQGNTVESCIVTKWHKKKGDEVAVGDILFTYETDKATFDEEAAVAGTILEIFFEEDDDVPVLSNMCVIGDKGEDISEFS
ncbi:MAG: lipoyl domain-containing protein, partial [Clostridia bacterium]|nr:lipoyl domain-containing protein [Clostridia bacterium]